jgi:hypothetical protein
MEEEARTHFEDVEGTSDATANTPSRMEMMRRRARHYRNRRTQRQLQVLIDTFTGYLNNTQPARRITPVDLELPPPEIAGIGKTPLEEVALNKKEEKTKKRASSKCVSKKDKLDRRTRFGFSPPVYNFAIERSSYIDGAEQVKSFFGESWLKMKDNFNQDDIRDYTYRNDKPIRRKVISQTLSILEQFNMIHRTGSDYSLNPKEMWEPRGKEEEMVEEESNDEQPMPVEEVYQFTGRGKGYGAYLRQQELQRQQAFEQSSSNSE